VALPRRPLLRFVFPGVLHLLRRFVFIAMTGVCLVLFPPPVGARTPDPLPSYADAPVFFELFGEAYADSINLTLLRENKVRLIPIGVENIDNFDWKSHRRKDLSWWMRIEDFRYLLPMINSGDREDGQFVRDWFDGWYEVHEQNPRPNPGAWQPMAAGIRAMVLVRLLKWVQDSGERDVGFETRLRESVIEHRQFLERDENFESRSNHGMWEALGLFETARVTGGSGMAAFALRRLAAVVDVSVSDAGVHKEHSAAYHFYFSRWLSEFVCYFETLHIAEWDDIETLSVVSEKMREASYYMFDHGGNVPQIGDTDATRIDPDSLGLSGDKRERLLFDEEGGIAVFKDPPDSGLARFITFNIRQLRNLTLSLAHTHRDILAVYFSWDGEVILGDGGRFEYRDSVARRFFTSSAAHNTIVPLEHLDSTTRVMGPIGGITPVLVHDSPSAVIEGSLNRNLAIRRLTIPLDEPRFRVDDSISPGFDVVILWNIGRDVSDVSAGRRVDRIGEVVHSWSLTTTKGRRFALDLIVPVEIGGDIARVEVLKGERDPMLGWYSPAYREMMPVTVIKLTLRSQNGTDIRTRIEKR
jgi:hypothetical protein